jgi:hypothetical protein
MIGLDVEEPMGNQNRKKAVIGRQSTLREGDYDTLATVTPHTALVGEEAFSVLENRRRPLKAPPPVMNGACADRKNGAEARPSAEIGELIGKELRSLYDDVVAQPVPDRFLDLLNQLESSTISHLSPKKASGV